MLVNGLVEHFVHSELTDGLYMHHCACTSYIVCMCIIYAQLCFICQLLHHCVNASLLLYILSLVKAGAGKSTCSCNLPCLYNKFYMTDKSLKKDHGAKQSRQEGWEQRTLATGLH
jgi:hypothetical protein